VSDLFNEIFWARDAHADRVPDPRDCCKNKVPPTRAEYAKGPFTNYRFNLGCVA
jgi:hypothetical protein